jgi:membrane-bound ClpP family serine protease
MKRFQLPSYFKKIGLAIAIGSMILIMINVPLWDSKMLLTAGKIGMLVGLLIASISKEKIEDELVVQLRMHILSPSFAAFYMLYSSQLSIMWSRDS